MKPAQKFNYFAAAAVLLQLFASVQDITIANIALPVLAQKFHISNSQSVWIITIYQIIITMLLLPLSALGERTSYRKIFMSGVAVFITGSACCALANGLVMLLCARALAGLGAACVMSVNTAIIRLIYPKKILGRGLALNAMTVAIASGAGPSMAGAILSVANWQWLFLINLPLGIIVLAMAWGRLPLNERNMAGFDWIGAAANALAFGLIFYAIGGFSRHPLPSAILLAIGCAVAFLHIRRQRNQAVPMFPLDLFRGKAFLLSVLTSGSSFVANNMTFVALPFLFYGAWGFSELMTGALMTPWPLATIAVAPFAARFVEKFNPSHLAVSGMAIYALGLLLIISLPATQAEAWSICWRLGICGIGFGLFQTPNNYIMITSTPLNRSGAAAGMQAFTRLSGQTFGAALVGLLFAIGPDSYSSARLCLSIALIFAIIAAIFSFGQTAKNKKAPSPTA